jgi:transcriptional regulator with XRE-family HTH domain
LFASSEPRPGEQPASNRQQSAVPFNAGMSHLSADRIAARAIERAVDDLARLIADSGLSHAAVARAAGMSAGYLADVLARKRRPTPGALAKLARPLGADLSIRLYPSTGPTIRDRHQARILEQLLGLLGGSWRPYTEVGVWKPVRGAIDAVLHDRRAEIVVAAQN